MNALQERLCENLHLYPLIKHLFHHPPLRGGELVILPSSEAFFGVIFVISFCQFNNWPPKKHARVAVQRKHSH